MLFKKEGLLKRYQSLRTPANHDIYIYARNRTKAILWLTKNIFINRKCQNLAFSSRDIWHLAKNISYNFTSSCLSPLLNPDGNTAVSYISKAELFSQTFWNNSTLDDSVHFPPTHHPSDSFMPFIKILHNDVFNALSGLNSQKAYGPDGVPPIVLKNWASILTASQVKLFRLCLSTSISPSCWNYAFL